MHKCECIYVWQVVGEVKLSECTINSHPKKEDSSDVGIKVKIVQHYFL